MTQINPDLLTYPTALGVGPMKVSSTTDAEMLRREADECTELLARATFISIIALLMDHADKCRIMADRIDEAQRRPSEHQMRTGLRG
jgi:hypothetical protein